MKTVDYRGGYRRISWNIDNSIFSTAHDLISKFNFQNTLVSSAASTVPSSMCPSSSRM